MAFSKVLLVTCLLACYLFDIQKLYKDNQINKLMELYLNHIKTNLVCTTNADLIANLCKLSESNKKVSKEYTCGTPAVKIVAEIRVSDRSIEVFFGNTNMGGYYEYDFTSWNNGILVAAFAYHVSPLTPLSQTDMIQVGARGLGLNPDSISIKNAKEVVVEEKAFIPVLFDNQFTQYLALNKITGLDGDVRMYFARCGTQYRVALAKESDIKELAESGYDAFDAIRLRGFLPAYMKMMTREKDPYSLRYVVDLVPGKKHNHKIDEYYFNIKRKQKTPSKKFSLDVEFKWAEVKLILKEGDGIALLLSTDGEASVAAWAKGFAENFYVPTTYTCAITANNAKELVCKNNSP